MTSVSAGRMPALGRLLTIMTLAAGLIAGPAAAGDFLPRLGNYFDEDEPGWGLDVQLADPERFGENVIFVIWFTYRPDGTPIWYLAAAELDGMSWFGNLDVFTWNREGLEASNETIGTIALEWSSETEATFSWELDGLTKGLVTGEREVSFFEFADGPTQVEYSGHYFQPGFSGWGMSLLTLGSVSVGTMYFYDPDDGEPFWVQGVDNDSDLVLNLDTQYFTGTDLCPSCLSEASKGEGSFESEPLTTVFVSYHRRFREEPERLDDLDLFLGLAHLFTSVNEETPLGDQPFSFAPGAVAAQALPGGSAYSTLMPLTPVSPSLSEEEIDEIVQLTDLEISLGIDITPGAIPDCSVQQVERLELEMSSDDYGSVLRNGSEVFFIDELGVVWNIPARIAAFKPGDEILSLMIQGGIDQDLADSFHLQWVSGPIASFLDDPVQFDMNQAVSARVNGMFSIPPRIFASRYSGVTEETCAVAFRD